MSIQSEISRITGNIASAYTALSAKGATMPSVQNTANLASAIESIETMVAEAMSIETIHTICYVPSDFERNYVELSYIEGDGASYIDTGFAPNQDTKVVMDIESAITTDHVLFSARTSASSKVMEMIWSSGGYYRFYYNNGSVNMTGISVSPATRRTITVDKNTATIDGYSVSRTYAAFQAECNMVLLARSTLGTIGAYTTGKLYSCQIYDNGTLIRDYVPCYRKSDGSVGLYDKANKRFYANDGSGSFAAGDVLAVLPDGYTRLEYIESSGTQYIDTKVVPSASTRLDMSFVPSTEGQSDNAMFGASWSNDGFLLTAYRGNVRFHSKGYYIDLTKKTGELNVLSCSPTSVTINGATYAMTGTGSDTQAYTIYLFWVGDESSPNNKGYYKLYSCKLYENGKLVRHFVPCTNASGVYGLYDMVKKQFYANAGSGSFSGA